MNLFGCKFCEKNDREEQQCDRKNFDTLLWALVTVFQVVFIISFLFKGDHLLFCKLTKSSLFFCFIKIGFTSFLCVKKVVKI